MLPRVVTKRVFCPFPPLKSECDFLVERVHYPVIVVVVKATWSIATPTVLIVVPAARIGYVLGIRVAAHVYDSRNVHTDIDFVLEYQLAIVPVPCFVLCTEFARRGLYPCLGAASEVCNVLLRQGGFYGGRGLLRVGTERTTNDAHKDDESKESRNYFSNPPHAYFLMAHRAYDCRLWDRGRAIFAGLFCRISRIFCIHMC